MCLKGNSIFLFILFLFLAKPNIAQKIQVPQLDTLNYIKINSILIVGNKKTKSSYILRELEFKNGDSIQLNKLSQKLIISRNNVFNTSLFNEVVIDTIQNKLNKNLLNIIINVKERFFMIPDLVLGFYDKNYKVWLDDYNGDINRIKYGVKFPFQNITGRRDNLTLKLVNGFSKELSFSYNQPFVDKKLKNGFGFGAGYIYKIGVSYSASNNAGLPRKLCDTCATPNYRLFNQTDYFLTTNYQYRKGIYERHIVGLNYVSTSVADTIIEANQNFFLNGISKTKYADLSYSYTYAKLDYNTYPNFGKAFSVGFKKRFSTDGLGQLILFGNYLQYFKINKKLNFSTDLRSSIRFNNNSNSFFNLKTSDFSNGNIRGLEQYLILSKSDISLRNTLRYKLFDFNVKSPLRIKNHEKIPFKIYARLFGDVAYVNLPTTNNSFSYLNNKLLRTTGFAIDVVTIYDFVYRFEFSYNQLGKFGFFVR